jgi:DNA-binding IclR family transcriptional regulator
MSLPVHVQQAMRVLELLAPEEHGLGVTQIAAELGVNKAIAHRILAALADTAYIEQDGATRTYRATHRLGALGVRQLEAAGVERWAQGPLDALAQRTQHLVRLAIAGDYTLQWIGRAQGARSRLLVDPAMGADVVLHATASGKAYLATLPADELEVFLASTELSRQTPNTIVEETELRAELEHVRERGFAVVCEEMDLGVNAMAAPIRGRSGSDVATGTVSIAGPAVLVPREALEAFAPLLVATAAELAERWPLRDRGRHEAA